MLSPQFLYRLNPNKNDKQMAEKKQDLNDEEDYFNFLMDVLQATSDSEGNAAVVYPLLQQNLDKLEVKLAEILQDWVREVWEETDPNQRFEIAVDIGTFGNLIQRFP
ncbi:MAG TPA: hypothetical protein V6D27_04835, partial [Vampirovibrionales bacterium]